MIVGSRARTAVIEMPPPEPISVRVDLQRSETESATWSGLWWVFPDEQTQRDAQAIMLRQSEQAAEAMDLQAPLAASRRQTEQVIHRFGRQIGWELQVRWRS